jgi:hypothetical protein
MAHPQLLPATATNAPCTNNQVTLDCSPAAATTFPAIKSVVPAANTAAQPNPNLPKKTSQQLSTSAVKPSAPLFLPKTSALPAEITQSTGYEHTSMNPLTEATVMHDVRASEKYFQAISKVGLLNPEATGMPATNNVYAIVAAIENSQYPSYDSIYRLENTPNLLSRPTSSLDVQPWSQKRRKGSLCLSLHTALTDNHYTWQQTVPGNLSTVRSRQKLSWRNEWGGSIRYAHGQWSLSAGLSTYSGQLSSLSRYRRRFDPGQEQTTPDGNALSTYSLSISNPYGNADVNVEIQRNTASSPPPYTTLFFAVASNQQMRAWQLPLLLGYHLPLGKTHLGIYAGPAFEFHQLETLQARIQVSAPGQFFMRPVGLPRQQIVSGVQLVSWSLALELSYPLNNDIRLYVRPFGQYSNSRLQPAQTNKYARWGSQIGICYQMFSQK